MRKRGMHTECDTLMITGMTREHSEHTHHDIEHLADAQPANCLEYVVLQMLRPLLRALGIL